MPQLLFFAYDHSLDADATPERLAELAKPFDLIAWQSDATASWGDGELTGACFRLVSWPDAPEANCDALMSPEMAIIDQNGTASQYSQFRATYVDLGDPTFAAQLPDVLAWWADATRALPMFVVPAGFSLDVDAVTKIRPPVGPT